MFFGKWIQNRSDKSIDICGKVALGLTLIAGLVSGVTGAEENRRQIERETTKRVRGEVQREMDSWLANFIDENKKK